MLQNMKQATTIVNQNILHCGNRETWGQNIHKFLDLDCGNTSLDILHAEARKWPHQKNVPSEVALSSLVQRLKD